MTVASMPAEFSRFFDSEDDYQLAINEELPGIYLTPTAELKQQLAKSSQEVYQYRGGIFMVDMSKFYSFQAAVFAGDRGQLQQAATSAVTRTLADHDNIHTEALTETCEFAVLPDGTLYIKSFKPYGVTFIKGTAFREYGPNLPRAEEGILIEYEQQTFGLPDDLAEQFRDLLHFGMHCDASKNNSDEKTRPIAPATMLEDGLGMPYPFSDEVSRKNLENFGQAGGRKSYPKEEGTSCSRWFQEKLLQTAEIFAQIWQGAINNEAPHAQCPAFQQHKEQAELNRFKQSVNAYREAMRQLHFPHDKIEGFRSHPNIPTREIGTYKVVQNPEAKAQKQASPPRSSDNPWRNYHQYSSLLSQFSSGGVNIFSCAMHAANEIKINKKIPFFYPGQPVNLSTRQYQVQLLYSGVQTTWHLMKKNAPQALIFAASRYLMEPIVSSVGNDSVKLAVNAGVAAAGLFGLIQRNNSLNTGAAALNVASVAMAMSH